MYKIKCLNPIAEVGLKHLTSDYVLTKQIEDADGVLVRSASMLEMELPDKLLAIARAGAGTNNIPVEECAQKGIVVFNTPGANANGVKELVMAGMLLSARDIVGGIEWVKSAAGDESIADIAKETEKVKKQFAGTELYGKKLGIIGLGAIGVQVANTAKYMGMEVYGYDPHISVDSAWNLSRDVKHVMFMDDIFSECDYISIHVPLKESTKYYINKEGISKMKDGVVLLNFARDLLANEEDVLDGIKSGKIRRYVTDFPNQLTAGAEGCIVIPHLGASTEESEDNCAQMAVKEMMNYLQNGNIKNSVNYPDCDMGVCTGAGRITVFHKNITKMINKFTACFGDKEINISGLTNTSKGDVAYTMIDVESIPSEEILQSLRNINGVFRIRIIH